MVGDRAPADRDPRTTTLRLGPLVQGTPGKDHTVNRARDLAVFFAAVALGIMCVDDLLGSPLGRRVRGIS